MIYSGMLRRNRTSRLGQRRGLRPTGGAEPPRRGKRLQLRRGLPGEVQGIDIRNYTTAAAFPIKIIKNKYFLRSKGRSVWLRPASRRTASNFRG